MNVQVGDRCGGMSMAEAHMVHPLGNVRLRSRRAIVACVLKCSRARACVLFAISSPQTWQFIVSWSFSLVRDRRKPKKKKNKKKKWMRRKVNGRGVVNKLQTSYLVIGFVPLFAKEYLSKKKNTLKNRKKYAALMMKEKERATRTEGNNLFFFFFGCCW
jgi:hypothetical protein